MENGHDVTTNSVKGLDLGSHTAEASFHFLLGLCVLFFGLVELKAVLLLLVGESLVRQKITAAERARLGLLLL